MTHVGDTCWSLRREVAGLLLCDTTTCDTRTCDTRTCDATPCETTLCETTLCETTLCETMLVTRHAVTRHAIKQRVALKAGTMPAMKSVSEYGVMTLGDEHGVANTA